jgi:transcriptional regulator with XRE-family HTH domain
MSETLTTRLAERLRQLRQEKGWSLEQLADKSGVSRATLSRMENAEVSPTTEMLGRLCSAHTMSLSRLLSMVEEGFVPLLRHDEQGVWADEESGFARRSVSPPAASLAAEVIEGRLEAGADIAYEAPSVPGMEHHLVLLEGELSVEIEGTAHRLRAGDCLRYQLFGASRFRTGAVPARYLLVMV